LALTFVERYHKHSDEFLNHIITVHEAWVLYVNGETKKQSRKLMAILGDKKRVLMVKFMQQEYAKTLEMNYETFKKLCMTIQNKWHGVASA
jgi:hypothetical protein